MVNIVYDHSKDDDIHYHFGCSMRMKTWGKIKHISCQVKRQQSFDDNLMRPLLLKAHLQFMTLWFNCHIVLHVLDCTVLSSGMSYVSFFISCSFIHCYYHPEFCMSMKDKLKEWTMNLWTIKNRYPHWCVNSELIFMLCISPSVSKFQVKYSMVLKRIYFLFVNILWLTGTAAGQEKERSYSGLYCITRSSEETWRCEKSQG